MLESVDRSAVVFFSWKRSYDFNPISLKSTVFQVAKCMKYLGLTLNYKLNWSDHL